MRDASATDDGLWLALLAIFIHALVGTLHAAAHRALGVELSWLQLIYIVPVIFLAPLVAGLLLWKKMKAGGAVLLFISLSGSLFFGVFNHFLNISPDHVSRVAELPQKSWGFVFQMSAVLLALSEAFGIWAGWRVLKKAEAKPDLTA